MRNETISIEEKKISEVLIGDPFMSLFPVREDQVEGLASKMKTEGFDRHFPLVLWGNRLVDGFTRCRSAMRAGLFVVPAIQIKFTSEDEAVLYAVRANADRRHLSDGEIFKLVPIIDERTGKKAKERKGVGRRGLKDKLTPNSASVRGESAEDTGKELGIGKNKVKQVRKLHRDADEITKKAILEGKKSINMAHREIGMMEKKQKREKDLIVGPEQLVMNIKGELQNKPGRKYVGTLFGRIRDVVLDIIENLHGNELKKEYVNSIDRLFAFFPDKDEMVNVLANFAKKHMDRKGACDLNEPENIKELAEVIFKTIRYEN